MPKSVDDYLNIACVIDDGKIVCDTNTWTCVCTSLFTAEFSIANGKAVEPDANLCATSIGDNAVTLTMLYNRHTPKAPISPYDDGVFAYSFDITGLEIPGNDSITVTFETKGADPSKIKVSRQDFYYHAQ